MTRPGRLLSAWGPVVLWCGAIFALSSLSLEGAPGVVARGDAAFHFAEYGVLGFLLARALGEASPGRGRGALVAAATLLAALYGASDELHQGFVPHREPAWGDLAADALGALAGALLRTRLAPRRRPGPGPTG